MLSSKLTLLACVLLGMSSLLTIDHSLMQNGLSSQILPKLTIGNDDVNRPISVCVPTNNAPQTHHGNRNCPLNYTLSLSQNNLIQVRGSSSVIELSVSLVSGVSVPVTLSSQGLPAGTQIQFASASAKPSFSSTITIATTAETPLGEFNITILAAGGGLVKLANFSLTVVSIVHDISVVSAMVQRSAAVGSIVSINTTVANYGSASEVFEIRAYANTSLVAKLSPIGLAASAVYAGRLTWNTTGFLPGTYTVLVAVPPVQGQLNLLDNSREAGRILLTQTPGSAPSPSPAAAAGSQGFAYWRQLAILAAIAEVAVVFLFVLLRRGKVPPETRQ